MVFQFFRVNLLVFTIIFIASFIVAKFTISDNFKNINNKGEEVTLFMEVYILGKPMDKLENKVGMVMEYLVALFSN
jgi:hypothetical protein